MPRKNPGSGSGNTISGTSGNDILSAVGGTFTLEGGRGDDTYIVDDSGDSVVEKKRGGTDTVIASVDWTLSNHVENLILDGSADLRGTGNAADNQITGNSGNNILDGRDGDDILSGGDGDDVLIGGGGSDTLSGGSGTDTAVFQGQFSDYAISGDPDLIVVTRLSSGETDVLDGIELLSFDDGTYAVADLFAPATPSAGDDSATTDEDTATVIAVLDNDSAGLSVVSVSGNARGSVLINGDGTLSYIPYTDETGLDTFTYTVEDANGQQTSAAVSVTITPVNDAPVAVNDAITVNADTLYSGSAGLLANDTDIDGDILTVSGIGVSLDSIQDFTAQDNSLTITTAAGGTVEVFADGSYTYTPATGFSGPDSFAYAVSDGAGGSATATVTIDVQDTGGTPPPGDPGPAPYYVEGLIFDDPYRLNAGDDVGTSVVVTYTFLDALPDYYDASSPIWSTFSAYSAQQQDAVRAMLAEIEDFANITFVEVTDGPATMTFGLADLGGYNGLAYKPQGLITGTIDSDIWIDTQHAGTEFIAGSYAYMNVVHEIGHALGLDHADLPPEENTLQYSVMDSSPDVYFSALPESFQLYDMAALQYLYGANTNYASGDDIYTFDMFDNTIAVLWDGGGHDRLDLSAASYGVEVDLTSGAFGTIAPNGAGNFVIAHGAVIEDVTGGAFNDVLSGNDADNRINGGLGDDLLSGGFGQDIFEFVSGWGTDTISDFDPLSDMIDLTGTGANFGQLDITYAGGNTIIVYQGDTIILTDIDAVDAGMFLF